MSNFPVERASGLANRRASFPPWDEKNRDQAKAFNVGPRRMSFALQIDPRVRMRHIEYCRPPLSHEVSKFGSAAEWRREAPSIQCLDNA